MAVAPYHRRTNVSVAAGFTKSSSCRAMSQWIGAALMPFDSPSWQLHADLAAVEGDQLPGAITGSGPNIAMSPCSSAPRRSTKLAGGA